MTGQQIILAAAIGALVGTGTGYAAWTAIDVESQPPRSLSWYQSHPADFRADARWCQEHPVSIEKCQIVGKLRLVADAEEFLAASKVANDARAVGQ